MLEREKTFKRDFRLDDFGVNPRAEAERGHHCRVNRLAAAEKALAGRYLVAKAPFAFPVNGERFLGKLHLADVDNVVRSVQQEVDLGAWIAVGILRDAQRIDTGVDSGNAEFPPHIIGILGIFG